jgi:hypothetical protein
LNNLLFSAALYQECFQDSSITIHLLNRKCESGFVSKTITRAKLVFYHCRLPYYEHIYGSLTTVSDHRFNNITYKLSGCYLNIMMRVLITWYESGPISKPKLALYHYLRPSISWWSLFRLLVLPPASSFHSFASCLSSGRDFEGQDASAAFDASRLSPVDPKLRLEHLSYTAIWNSLCLIL